MFKCFLKRQLTVPSRTNPVKQDPSLWFLWHGQSVAFDGSVYVSGGGRCSISVMPSQVIMLAETSKLDVEGRVTTSLRMTGSEIVTSRI